jgi:hypothetical protein
MAAFGRNPRKQPSRGLATSSPAVVQSLPGCSGGRGIVQGKQRCPGVAVTLDCVNRWGSWCGICGARDQLFWAVAKMCFNFAVHAASWWRTTSCWTGARGPREPRGPGPGHANRVVRGAAGRRRGRGAAGNSVGWDQRPKVMGLDRRSTSRVRKCQSGHIGSAGPPECGLHAPHGRILPGWSATADSPPNRQPGCRQNRRDAANV